MRVAALYDIHGNLPALEAVLDDIEQARVDRVVVGGDVLPGPMPEETLACLLGLKWPVQFIVGNGEVAVLEVIAGREPAAVPEAYRPIIRWTAGQLSSRHKDLLATWPKTLTMNIPEPGEVLFCHATPRDENEIFTQRTCDDRLFPVFQPIAAPVVVCGHTHMQFERILGRTRIVNAGSLGMPFGDSRACWLLLGPEIQLRRTVYDLTKAAERIRATAYPQAEEFAERSILHPPSEQQMLELFARAELK